MSMQEKVAEAIKEAGWKTNVGIAGIIGGSVAAQSHPKSRHAVDDFAHAMGNKVIDMTNLSAFEKLKLKAQTAMRHAKRKSQKTIGEKMFFPNARDK